MSGLHAANISEQA